VEIMMRISRNLFQEKSTAQLRKPCKFWDEPIVFAHFILRMKQCSSVVMLQEYAAYIETDKNLIILGLLVGESSE
jgi:hypothetical protein